VDKRKFKNVGVLFGGGSITSLGFMRNLGRNGVPTFYVGERRCEAIFSRYCKRYFLVPEIEHNIEVLKRFLKKLEKQSESNAIIFPGSDLFCLSLSELESENYHVLLPNKEIVDTLINKKRFYQSLAKRNMPHPTTHFPKNPDDVENMRKKVSYPVYIRPSISQVFDERFHQKGFVAKSEEEMARYYKLALRHNVEVMVQEIIPGPATNLFGVNGYFDKESNPHGLFVYRRLREWPHKFGNNSLIESVSTPSTSSLKDVVTDYLRNLRYHGLIDAEFKKDPRDGVFKLLEINARCWWQNSFPTKCGINLVFMAYLDAISEKMDYTENYDVGLKWLYFLSDFRSSIKMLRNKETTVREWISSFRGVKDHAFFSLDDPLPWTIQPLFILDSFRARRAPEECRHGYADMSKAAPAKLITGAGVASSLERVRILGERQKNFSAPWSQNDA